MLTPGDWEVRLGFREGLGLRERADWEAPRSGAGEPVLKLLGELVAHPMEGLVRPAGEVAHHLGGVLDALREVLSHVLAGPLDPVPSSGLSII
jgi:hypothetical protein